MLVDVGGTRLLTDPLLRGRVAHLRWRARPPDVAALGRIDAVLLSHAHLDHLDLPSLRSLGEGVRVIAPRGSERLLARAGVGDLTEVVAGDELQVGGARITAVPAVHSGRRHPLAAPVPALGFVVSGPRSIYFAGDTEIFDGMSDLGPLDVALLPVWGWGPRLGPGHMGPEQAARALGLLRPGIAVPIHWGALYPLGLRRFRPHLLSEPPRAFARIAARLAPDVEVRVLAPGESLVVPSSAGDR